MTVAEPAVSWMMRQDEIPVDIQSASFMENLVNEAKDSVRYLAKRLASRLPAHVDVEDLYQMGMIGLLQSVDRFDDSRGIKFQTYANRRVQGAMLDYLRSLDWRPRSVRRRNREIAVAVSTVEQRLGGSASTEEITAQMDISMDEYHQWMSEGSIPRAGEFIHADAHSSSSVDDFMNTIADTAATPEQAVLSIDVSRNFGGDLAAAVLRDIPPHKIRSSQKNGPSPTIGTKLGLMLWGIDTLLYQDKRDSISGPRQRPPFAAQLNFDRERLAELLPYPVVFWVADETYALLLKQAPDLIRWVSASFVFDAPTPARELLGPVVSSFDAGGEATKEAKPGPDRSTALLLEELKITPASGGPESAAKRLSLLTAIVERLLDAANFRQGKLFAQEGLELSRLLNNRRGEGNALGNLGIAYAALGETRRAIDFYEQRLVIAREIGDRLGEGNALGNLGIAYAGLGETRRAIEYHEKALVIDSEIGDRRGEGNGLGNLGIAYADLGETRRAIDFFEQRLVIAREIGDRRGEGNALGNMSLALDKLGERKQAIERAEAALKIFEQTEDPNAAKVSDVLEQWKK
ncbi:MAG: sigma-70 family RNA polymerase sigma factor [Acidobacteria bacterium]|nr:sigma-70 family RNA polymerase sigma factor [Acidobacteriota bacterium]